MLLAKAQPQRPQPSQLVYGCHRIAIFRFPARQRAKTGKRAHAPVEPEQAIAILHRVKKAGWKRAKQRGFFAEESAQ